MKSVYAIRTELLAFVAVVMFGLGGLALAGEEPSYVNTFFSDEYDFDEMKDNVKLAIEERGMNIANELHASDMLNRTGPDLGFMDAIYKHAETVEFCSAVISHKLVQANVHNVVMCPFAVSIYVLNAEPGRVYVSYRVPMAGAETAGVTAEVDELVRGIAEDAIE